MVRATTPTFNLTISGQGVDLTQAASVYVSVAQGNTNIELTGEALDVGVNTISCYLTQEQSLNLFPDKAKIQVNWTYVDNDGNIRRAATVVRTITIGEQLLRRVLTE